MAGSFGESQKDHLVRSGERDGWVCKRQNLQLSQAGIVLEYFRPRKEGREFRIILANQEGRVKQGKEERRVK